MDGTDDHTDPKERRSTWAFLTNHARVLLILAREPEARMRDIAEAIGITERAAQNIVTDLEHDGYVQRERQGRRNRYTLVPGRHLRRPTEQTVPVQA
ncbi:MarR family transcriptional regulator, partial [Nonomuraea sp. NN258]|uniref:helix-turn-helix transcriptional regulator n=1 Tax=Nonomuraea antri TaxID=2730852 RepID=UPI00156A1039